MSDFALVASGYSVVEGPVVNEAGDLFFTNVHEGGVYVLRASGEIEEVIPRRRGVGGMCLHADGGLIVSGRDVSHIGPGQTRVLAERSGFPLVDGVPVGGFNDLCADQLGRVLVGPTRRRPVPANDATPLMSAGEHVPSELVLITAPGRFTTLYADVRGVSNGLAVSADNSTIYHAESGGQIIRVSRFTAPERVETVATWPTTALAGTPDGVALDVDGFLWVAMHGGGAIVRFSPAGAVDRVLGVPATRVTNLCFAGPYLYITSLDNDQDPQRRGSIFRTAAPVPGAAVPVARI